MGSNRYCKCHFYEGESEHWGLLDRKAFAHKGAQPHYAPDTVLSPCHLLLELSFDWEEERVWGSTTYELEVKGPGVTEIAFDAMNLDISRVLLGRKQVDFENTGTRLILHAPKPLAVGSRVKVKVFHSVTRPVAGISTV